ncbi:glycerol-3-phosphate dehydrogenase/oxidase [Nocardioides marmoriginsengisoli]|uniref:Glycerol-3-phosphate dehydrogenase/oxidase n=1 Tax=Nocardioides marmoriginsengisoli TaxID=661483 RepID=A0A3N0CCE4_9ACTN|nr:glycerol-3-phosphate dehydrogenase/oxidase [Nocardioides marmoriginsengisoli]RNL60653.1 glycerol-3-phosphate dehydrogenase/oxidase [Nocardioides marmoriginsengisoli]
MSTGRITAGSAGIPESTDVLVIGLGVTGAGVALDAAARGLDVVAVDAFDVAWGTSRFSSKLVHGGLRYLAKGQVAIAHESAVERGILMESTAPHLIRALPMVIPLTSDVTAFQAFLARRGVGAGDLLRKVARTGRETLPKPRRISATETKALAGVIRRDTRGGVLSWDGQLEDDARLVVGLARTAAAEGAQVHTRTRVLEVTGDGALLRDELTGEERRITAKAVINATGVWAGTLIPGIVLKPSRGTHVVLRASSLPSVRCAIMAPVPGSSNRFVFALPQPDGNIYLGLTDEEVDGEIPDVPEVPEEDVTFLLDVISRVLETPLTRDDVVGAYAGLRPLLKSDGSTADLSRKHAVLTSDTGVITIVGGKLTTYRRMAEDAVDAAVAQRSLAAGPCRTKALPILGAADADTLAHVAAPPRLVRRFGTEAPDVLANALAHGLSEEEALTPVSATVPATLAELVFGITHEGAADVDDLLDRRTKIGLVPVDREAALPLAQRAFDVVARART